MGKKRIMYIYKTIKSPLDDDDDDDIESSTNSDNLILQKLMAMESGKNNKKEESDKPDSKKKKKKKKKKKSKLKDRLDEFDIYDKDEIRDKKKNREAVDFYEQRFSSSLILLANLMGEINTASDRGRDYLKKLQTGKIRTSPMAVTNQMSNINGLLSTKLNVIKEINVVNNKISELELKKQASLEKSGKAKEEAENNSQAIIDKMFGKLMNTDIPVPKSDRIKSKSNKSKKELSKDINKRIDELEELGDIEFTDSELAFKYEKDNVKIIIEKNLDNGRWRFVAIDENGDELFDYPVPSKQTVGNIIFDEDTMSAKDRLGQHYDVLPVDSFDDMENLNEEDDDD